MLAAHICLVWTLPWFPTQDGPAHVYNLVILHDLLNGGKDWGNFFTYKLSAVPNLGFNLLSYPLLVFLPPLIVEKIFVSLYILLMGICVPVFLKTFERAVFPLAFLVFPVIFNFTLLMGFYSYVIAVPFFILAFSMAWKIRGKSSVCRFTCLNLTGVVLFYLHLIPFVFFLTSLCAIVMAEQPGVKGKMTNLAKLSFIMSPCLLQLVLYLGQGKRIRTIDFSYLFSQGRNADLIKDLISFSTMSHSPLHALPAKLLAFAFLFFLLLFIFGKLHEKKLQVPAGEKTLFWLISALTITYFLAPFRFGEGSFFNQRFPWVIFLIALPLLRIPASPLLRCFSLSLVAGVVGLNFAVDAFLLQQQNIRVEKFVSGLSAGLPKGALVMTFKTEDEWYRIDVLMHAASYYGILGGCVDIGNYEASFDLFPVHFKKNLPAFPLLDQIDEPKRINWHDYPSIRYLIGWGVGETEMTELKKFYRLIRLDGPLSIWQRRENAQCTEIAISGNHANLKASRMEKEYHAQHSHTGL